MKRVLKIAKSDYQILIYPFYRLEQLYSYWNDCYAIFVILNVNSKIYQNFKRN